MLRAWATARSPFGSCSALPSFNPACTHRQPPPPPPGPHLCPWRSWVVFGVATGGFWFLVASIFLVRSYLLAHYRYRIWRLMRTLLVVLLLGFAVSGTATKERWQGGRRAVAVAVFEQMLSV